MPSLPPLPPPVHNPFQDLHYIAHVSLSDWDQRRIYICGSSQPPHFFVGGGGLYKEKVPHFVRGNTENDASLFTPYTACPSLLSIPPPKKKQSVTICTTDVQYTLSMCVFVSLSNFFIKVIQIRI